MKCVSRLARALLMLALPVLAYAQQAARLQARSAIMSGAVLPGVTVEVSSPAHARKDAFGRHRRRRQIPIVQLRPGTHSAVFTAPALHDQARQTRTDVRLHGDGQRRHEGWRAGRDHHGRSHVADRRRRASRSALSATRDVKHGLDLTGRNIQAIGITFSRRRRSPLGRRRPMRDVGGSATAAVAAGYCGLGDTVQTIEGLREQPEPGGVYWNDGSPGNQLRDVCGLCRNGA